MGWNPIGETTIVTPFYNTRPEYFLSYLTSMAKFPEVPIIIGNDGSDKRHRLMLHDMVKKHSNIRIIDYSKNIGMCGTLHKILKEVETKYVIKCDSDDGIHHFPEFSTEDNSADFDAAITRNCRILPTRFLADRGNAPGGSVYKTEVFQKIYEDWEFMDRNEKWIHEDVWMHLNLTMGGYNIEHEVSEDDTKIYEYK
jgi:glycosyltransferase involved in cell wall biosynthesis